MDIRQGAENRKKMVLHLLHILLHVAGILLVLSYVLHYFGVVAYLVDGVQAKINNPCRYNHRESTELIEVDFTIPLDDWDRCIGQAIYEKDGRSIVIDELYYNEDGVTNRYLCASLRCTSDNGFQSASYYTPRSDKGIVGWSRWRGEEQTMDLRSEQSGGGRDYILYHIYVTEVPYDADLSGQTVSCTLKYLTRHRCSRKEC